MRKIVMLFVGASLALAPLGSASASDLHRWNIIDPPGDANGLNDQGLGAVLGFQGDESARSSFDPADIQKVWFDNDHRQVSVHVITAAPPPDGDPALSLRVEANSGCLRFEAVVPGKTYAGPARAWVSSPASGNCGGGIDPVPGSLTIQQNRDGSGVTTMSFRLGSHPNLRPYGWFMLPTANTRLVVGDDDHGPVVAQGQFDNTREGISYRIEEVPPPVVTPPVTPDPSANGKAKSSNGKKKGHEKHGCDHPGHGHGHDDDCPEDQDDRHRPASGKAYYF